MSNTHFDIVIGGGGMVGTTLALALQPLGLRVAVVEPIVAEDSRQPSFDDRSTALSRSTQRMFDAMGLWPAVRGASTPIRKIHVSERGQFGFAHIDAKEQGVEALGHVVINRVLGHVLKSAMQKGSDVSFLSPDRIIALDPRDDAVGIELESGKRLTAELLVCADGARSALRDMLGIGVEHKDYGQTAIIGNLRTELSNDNVAYERFTEDGPIAMLPIADERTAFIWISGTDDARARMQLDDAAFTDALLARFGRRLGGFSRIGTRVAYPLTLSKAQRLTRGRCVLIGNAAHGLHPVAAQGFNLGLRDVAALCDCIRDDFDRIPVMLERYAEWRANDQQTLVRITDGLVNLFGSERRLVRFGRNLGMLGFDLIPGVKGAFAKQMMGLNGLLPRLSRGVALTGRERAP
jgi:2-octaprenyl-6-methoxyphenol hydroxylase